MYKEVTMWSPARNDSFCSEKSLQDFMENGGRRLMVRFFKDNVRGLSFNDVYQELMITTAHTIAMYEEARIDVKLSTYIWASWENTLKMIYRRNDSQKEQINKTMVDPIEAAASIAVNPMDKVDHDLSVRAAMAPVYKLLSDPKSPLTKVEKTVIRLTLKGCRQATIGRVVNLSQGTVSKIYTTALDKIRTALSVSVKGA